MPPMSAKLSITLSFLLVPTLAMAVAPPPSTLSQAKDYAADLSWYGTQLGTTEYRVTAWDLGPRLSASGLHARFAPPWLVVDLEKRPDAKLERMDEERPGRGGFTILYDLNTAELRQIRREVGAGRLPSVLTPSTVRVAVDGARYGEVVKRLAKAYGLKPGDYQPEYTTTLHDRAGNEYVGVGVRVGGTLRFLIARVRKSG